MKNLLGVNGLVVWDAKEIQYRQQAVDQLSLLVEEELSMLNPAWSFHQFEVTTLVPRNIISPEYDENDIYVQQVPERVEPHIGTAGDPQRGHELVLRPETTPGSYVVARALLDNATAKPPFCVWQYGKSFRREQAQPTKFMRLQEFYQLEFQCVYTTDTAHDYKADMIPHLKTTLRALAGVNRDEVRVIESDRIPAYSEGTTDIEIFDRMEDRWMEVCSVSTRTDFPGVASFQTKKGTVEKDVKVLEIAVGLDRLLYHRFNS